MVQKLGIPTDRIDREALEWWLSLPPNIRAVKIQALWECEGEPPRLRKRRVNEEVI